MSPVGIPGRPTLYPSSQEVRMSQQAIDLQIGGMTCASCAARIEKKLNRMPGVEATVNFATEKAHVVLPAGTDVDAAIATVQATGYTARLPEPRRPPADAASGPGAAESDQDREV